MEMARGNKKSIGRVVWNAGGKPSIMGILVVVKMFSQLMS